MFKVGDKVRITHILATYSGEITCEDTGTVCDLTSCNSDNAGVEFERNVGGHVLYSGEQHCKNGHGWYVPKNKLEKIKEEVKRMKIEYTYVEPDDRPIKKAEFTVNAGGEVVINLLSDSRVEMWIFNCSGKERSVATYSKEEFTDFTVLINRINKQIGN